MLTVSASASNSTAASLAALFGTSELSSVSTRDVSSAQDFLVHFLEDAGFAGFSELIGELVQQQQGIPIPDGASKAPTQSSSSQEQLSLISLHAGKKAVNEGEDKKETEEAGRKDDNTENTPIVLAAGIVLIPQTAPPPRPLEWNLPSNPVREEDIKTNSDTNSIEPTLLDRTASGNVTDRSLAIFQASLALPPLASNVPPPVEPIVASLPLAQMSLPRADEILPTAVRIPTAPATSPSPEAFSVRLNPEISHATELETLPRVVPPPPSQHVSKEVQIPAAPPRLSDPVRQSVSLESRPQSLPQHAEVNVKTTVIESAGITPHPSPQAVATNNSNTDGTKREAQHHQEAPPDHEIAVPKPESTATPSRPKPLETLRQSVISETSTTREKATQPSATPPHSLGVHSLSSTESSLPIEANDSPAPVPFNVSLEMEPAARTATHALTESRQIRLPIENSPEGLEVRIREQAGNIEVSVVSQDQNLRTRLQSNLQDLVASLEGKGIAADVRSAEPVHHNPAIEAADLHRDLAVAQSAETDSSSQQNSTSQDQRDSPQRSPWDQPKDDRRRRDSAAEAWMNILEEIKWLNR